MKKYSDEARELLSAVELYDIKAGESTAPPTPPTCGILCSTCVGCTTCTLCISLTAA